MSFFERYRCRFSKNPLVILEYEFVFSNKEVIYKVEYNAKTKNISEEITIDAIVVLKRDGTKGELRIGDSVILDEQLDNKTLFFELLHLIQVDSHKSQYFVN